MLEENMSSPDTNDEVVPIDPHAEDALAESRATTDDLLSSAASEAQSRIKILSRGVELKEILERDCQRCASKR